MKNRTHSTTVQGTTSTEATARFKAMLSALVILVLLGWISVSPAATLSKQLSKEEKASFQEAEGRFPRKVLPKIFPNHAERAFWLDDTHAIFSTRSIGDWKAADDERSKIVVLNIETGQVEVTRYRGELMCLNPEKMLVRDYPAPWEFYSLPGDERDAAKRHYIVGRYGDDLKPIEIPEEHGLISQITCESYSTINHNFGKEYFIRPLRPEHGYFANANSVESNRFGYWLFSPQKKEVIYLPSAQCEGANDLLYVPWERRYWVSGAMDNCPKRSWLISPDGKSDIVDAPDIMGKWKQQGIIGFRTAWTKAGAIFMVSAQRGYGERSGMYWLDAQRRLRKIFKGEAAIFRVSPDGCRMLFGYYPGTTMDTRGAKNYENSMINICVGRE